MAPGFPAIYAGPGVFAGKPRHLGVGQDRCKLCGEIPNVSCLAHRTKLPSIRFQSPLLATAIERKHATTIPA